ncbi:hypothetical protein [Empedobacter tilapiae]|uniref:hypothetical protein n=1 Tax=Empedobacter tilapiae TaxID=2491114 RepID=UPI0028D3785F|nr:hypothetical protein [Empedobacter tilapiae]
MNETVTVDEAISKGHRMITYPVMVIMFGTIGITLYLGSQKLIPAWGFLLGFILAFVFAWLWWSFMITKWRLWAFDNVRNVHELNKRAIQEKLIWSNNSIFGKTEIRTTKEVEKLNTLSNKFNQEDFFQDDLTVADETIIYYSKSKNFVEMAIMLGCLGVGIYSILIGKSYIVGSILSIIGVFFGYKKYKDATNTEPQIIINERGIKTRSTDFYSWNEIENEDVISKGSGKNIRYYLIYNYPDGSERLLIDNYDIDIKSLNQLLILYRGRSKKTISNR